MLGTAIVGSSAFAQVWTSNGDTDFNKLDTNWSPALTYGGTATFDGTGTANPALTADFSVSTLTFSAGNYTLSGTNTLSVETGGLSISGSAGNTTISAPLSFALNSPIALSGSNQSLAISGSVFLNGTVNIATGNATSNSVSLSGVISGSSGAIVKNGSGTLTLSNAANSFGGDVFIYAGTLVADSVANRGVSSPLGAGSNIRFDGTASGATSTLRYTGAAASTDRSIFLPTNNNATSVIDSSGSGPLTFTGNVTAGKGQSNTSRTLGLSGTTLNNTIAGVISNVRNTPSAVVKVEKTGTGSWILTGNNTYTGGTTITAGTLQIGAGGTTGSIAGASVVNNAALVFNRSDAVGYSGVISGTGTVTQAGGGTLTLSGANTYTGTTTVSAGTLQVGAGGTSGALASASLVNNAAVVFNRSDALSYSGVISGTGNVTQSGSGALTLSGANTYTGPTVVNAGSLLVTGSLASGSAVTVNSGGTLGGSGTIGGATTIASGGTLAPGASPGVLSFGGNLTLLGTTTMELNGTVRGTSYDGINVAGTTNYGGTLALTFGTTFSNGTTLDLFQLTGGVGATSFSAVTAAGGYTGSFTNSGGVWSLLSGDQTLTFSQGTGDLAFSGGSVSAVPEPSTYALWAGMATLACVVVRRAGKRKPAAAAAEIA